MIMPFSPSFPQLVENGVEKRRFYTPTVEIFCRKLRNCWGYSLIYPLPPVENSDFGVFVIHIACGKEKFSGKLHKCLWIGFVSYQQKSRRNLSTTTNPVRREAKNLGNWPLRWKFPQRIPAFSIGSPQEPNLLRDEKVIVRIR